MRLDGIEILKRSLLELDMNLNDLIARTSIWVNPEFYRYHIKYFGTGVYYPNTRRMKVGEKKGQVIDGVRMDDNTYANTSIKQTIGGRNSLERFSVCHIYPNSCYDPNLHTELANLVLIPSPLASLTDYFEETIAVLKYRAYEQYGFYVSEVPPKPEKYPNTWRSYIKYDEEIQKVIIRKKTKLARMSK